MRHTHIAGPHPTHAIVTVKPPGALNCRWHYLTDSTGHVSKHHADAMTLPLAQASELATRVRTGELGAWNGVRLLPIWNPRAPRTWRTCVKCMSGMCDVHGSVGLRAKT